AHATGAERGGEVLRGPVVRRVPGRAVDVGPLPGRVVFPGGDDGARGGHAYRQVLGPVGAGHALALRDPARVGARPVEDAVQVLPEEGVHAVIGAHGQRGVLEA